MMKGGSSGFRSFPYWDENKKVAESSHALTRRLPDNTQAII
jgi:hypothetical protein